MPSSELARGCRLLNKCHISHVCHKDPTQMMSHDAFYLQGDPRNKRNHAVEPPHEQSTRAILQIRAMRNGSVA